jgi:hypothetical protein
MVCVAEGGDCTTDTDCCAGLLCINGKCGKVVTCAAYGQSCTTNSDCCNMVPCTRAMPSDPTGFCRVPTG